MVCSKIAVLQVTGSYQRYASCATHGRYHRVQPVSETFWTPLVTEHYQNTSLYKQDPISRAEAKLSFSDTALNMPVPCAGNARTTARGR